MWQRFEERIDELPMAWFNKRESLIEVSYRSELGTEEKLVGKNLLPSTVEMFTQAYTEAVEALAFASERLKNVDGIDWRKLLQHMNQKLNQVPTNDVQLKSPLCALHENEKQDLLS